MAALVSPFAPHLGEELWNKLGGDGLVVQADWPTADRDVSAYREERRLVEDTRADVRDIVETAAIEDPERVDLVVAPDWKFEALEAMADHGADVDAVADGVDRPAEAVGPFLSDHSSDQSPALDADKEGRLLEAASWLIADEFDVTVAVRQAVSDDDLADRARPGKPAIRVS